MDSDALEKIALTAIRSLQEIHSRACDTYGYRTPNLEVAATAAASLGTITTQLLLIRAVQDLTEEIRT